MSQSKNNITNKTAKLDELLAWFSSDQFNIDQAVEQYKKAEALAEEIEANITSLKNEVIILKQKFDIENNDLGD